MWQPSGSDGISQPLEWQNTVTLNRTACVSQMGLSHGPHIQRNMLCTTNPINVGLCGEDFGGPLTNQDTPKVLLGIASWIISCSRGWPDVYTRVYPHLEFIRGAMRMP